MCLGINLCPPAWLHQRTLNGIPLSPRSSWLLFAEPSELFAHFKQKDTINEPA